MTTVRIPLSSGNHFTVDRDDIEIALRYEWKGDHLTCGEGPDSIVLAHLILEPLPGHYIDHKDGNPLNNTRANLRQATPQQNTFNRRKSRTSPNAYKGITYKRWKKRWVAQMSHNGTTRYLGKYKTAEEAARAYDDAGRELHGEL
jgi:hypothetical protein